MQMWQPCVVYFNSTLRATHSSRRPSLRPLCGLNYVTMFLWLSVTLHLIWTGDPRLERFYKVCPPSGQQWHMWGYFTSQKAHLMHPARISFQGWRINSYWTATLQNMVVIFACSLCRSLSLTWFSYWEPLSGTVRFLTMSKMMSQWGGNSLQPVLCCKLDKSSQRQGRMLDQA